MRYYSIRIFFITLIGLFAIPLMGQGKTDQQIIYKPVGVFHSEYTERTGAPRQGILKPDGKGTIEIFNEYRGAMKSLELFEYIIVIYHFDRAYNWNLIVKPPASDPDLTFGLFATRSPNRPNPIGIATVRLDKVGNGILHVSGIDAFDGTPVLDIKPYLPSIDCVKSSINEQTEKKLGL